MMMKITVVLILFFGVLFFFSCKAKEDIATTTNQVEAAIPIITYSKGSCRGFCPVLSLEIYENGNVKYIGTKHVDHIGSFSTNLRTDQLNRILDKCESGGFLKMESSYLSGFMDIPDMKVAYKGHEIRFHTRKAPKPLSELMDLLDEIALNTNWKINPKK